MHWNGHRPIIDQVDLHVSSKLTRLNDRVCFSGLGYEVVVQTLSISCLMACLLNGIQN